MFFWSSDSSSKSPEKIVDTHFNQLFSSTRYDQLETSTSKIIEMAKEYPETVSQICMPGLLDALDRLQDQDEVIIGNIINLIVYLCELPDYEEQQFRDLAEQNVNQTLADVEHFQLLLSYSEKGNVYLRKCILGFVNYLLKMDQNGLEKCILDTQHCTEILVNTLSDPKPEIVLSSLTIIRELCKSNIQIQNQFCFLEIFDQLKDIVKENISDDTVTLVSLEIINNLTREADNLQKAFCSSSFMSILPYFLSTNNHFDDSIYDAVITILENLIHLNQPKSEDESIQLYKEKTVRDNCKSLIHSSLLLDNLVFLSISTENEITEQFIERCRKVLLELLKGNENGSILFNSLTINVQNQQYNIVVYIIQSLLDETNHNLQFYKDLFNILLPSISILFIQNMIKNEQQSSGYYILNMFCSSLSYLLSNPSTDINYEYNKKLFLFLSSIFQSMLQFNTSENHIKKSMLDILTVPPFESIPLIHLLFNLILIDSIPLFIQSELTFMLLLWINNENDTYIYLSSYPTPLLSLIDNISTLLNTNMTKENYDYELQNLGMKCLVLCSLLSIDMTDEQTSEDQLTTTKLATIINNKCSMNNILNLLTRFFAYPPIQTCLSESTSSELYSLEFLLLCNEFYSFFKSYTINSYMNYTNPTVNNEAIEQLQKQLDSKLETIQELETALTTVQDERNTLQREKNQLDQDYQQSKKENSDLKQQLEESKQLELELKTNYQNQIEELKKEKQDQTKSMTQLKNEYQDKEQQYQSEMETFKKEKEQFDMETKTTIQELTVSVEEKQKTIEELSLKVNEQDQQLATLQSTTTKNNELSLQIESITKELIEKDQQLSSCTLEKQQYEEKINELQTKNNELTQSIQETKESNESLSQAYQQRIHQLEEELQQKEQDCNELKKENEVQKESLNSSSTLSNQAILEKEQLQQQIVELNETIQKFKETTSQLMKEINEKKQTIQSLETTIAEYNSEAAEEMKQELIKKNKEIITLLGYIQQLQSDSM